MTVVITIVLVALLLTNCIQVYKLSEKLEHVEDVLLDLDIIYIKLQQFFRDH